MKLQNCYQNEIAKTAKTVVVHVPQLLFHHYKCNTAIKRM